MYFHFDAMVGIRNAPLKQLSWELDWSRANEENGSVNPHLVSREG